MLTDKNKKLILRSIEFVEAHGKEWDVHDLSLFFSDCECLGYKISENFTTWLTNHLSILNVLHAYLSVDCKACEFGKSCLTVMVEEVVSKLKQNIEVTHDELNRELFKLAGDICGYSQIDKTFRIILFMYIDSLKSLLKL